MHSVLPAVVAPIPESFSSPFKKNIEIEIWWSAILSLDYINSLALNYRSFRRRHASILHLNQIYNRTILLP